MLTELRRSIGDEKESKMSSSQAGLWSDGNSSALGMVWLRYYGPRDGGKGASSYFDSHLQRQSELMDRLSSECWKVSMTRYGADRCVMTPRTPLAGPRRDVRIGNIFIRD